ncbi:MAG: ABC transporter permease [Acidobacteria bacterium]|nr:ABC transporter permease [Acidobacteriota bacterium]
MGSLLQDVRYGVRMLLKQPGFTLIAVIALAIGVGANTTIFSFVNGLVLRPIQGVKEPERLAAVYTSDYDSGIYGASSYPDYVDFRNQADAFEALAAYGETVMSLTGVDEAERLRGAYVTGNYFDVLGVGARLGRTLQPADDVTPGAHPVVVISHSVWQRRFGADPGVVGKGLALDGVQYTVVGVTAESFRGLRLGQPPEFWIPMMMEPVNTLSKRGNRGVGITGRLKMGVTPEQAQSQLTTIATRLAEAYPETNLGTLERPKEPRPVTALRESRIGPAAQRNIWFVSLLLFGVVGLVLLIACANVANLTLARASARRREIAVRLALGASRWRLVRQLLTESTMLALVGGGAGLFVALWVVDLLPSFFPPEELGGIDLSLDWRVLAFSFSVSVLTGLLFGLVPALQASRPDLVPSLKEDAGGSGYGPRHLSLRNGLVIAQLAMSLVLLIGAGLFLRSLSQAVAFDPGFTTQNLLLASLETRGAKLSKEQGQAFYQQAMERVGALPGVSAVSLTGNVPISGGGSRRTVEMEGYQPQPNESTELNFNVVGSAYFNTMNISVVAGRDFNSQDREGSPGVVIINEELAHRYFPGQNAVGKRMRLDSELPFAEIVGIVRNAKYRDLREDTLPFIYVPLAQEYRPGMTLLVRTTIDPATVLPSVRSEIHSLNRDVPIYAVKTMTEHIGAALAPDRMLTVLLSIFGGMALLLAVTGIYGVMSYMVARRTHEIGIRMALGANQGDILKLIVKQGLTLILIGAALGLALAIALTRVISSLLFNVSTTDSLTFGGISLLLVAVALVACYMPARRAMKVDPMVALRYE